MSKSCRELRFVGFSGLLCASDIRRTVNLAAVHNLPQLVTRVGRGLP